MDNNQLNNVRNDYYFDKSYKSNIVVLFLVIIYSYFSNCIYPGLSTQISNNNNFASYVPHADDPYNVIHNANDVNNVNSKNNENAIRSRNLQTASTSNLKQNLNESNYSELQMNFNQSLNCKILNIIVSLYCGFC